MTHRMTRDHDRCNATGFVTGHQIDGRPRTELCGGCNGTGRVVATLPFAARIVPNYAGSIEHDAITNRIAR